MLLADGVSIPLHRAIRNPCAHCGINAQARNHTTRRQVQLSCSVGILPSFSFADGATNEVAGESDRQCNRRIHNALADPWLTSLLMGSQSQKLRNHKPLYQFRFLLLHSLHPQLSTLYPPAYSPSSSNLLHHHDIPPLCRERALSDEDCANLQGKASLYAV